MDRPGPFMQRVDRLLMARNPDDEEADDPPAAETATLKAGRTSARRRLPGRWWVALGFAAVSIGLRVAALGLLGPHAVFALAYFASVAAAWYGGFGPGVLATLVCLVLTPLALNEAPGQLLALTAGLYLIFGVLVSVLSATLQRARRLERQRADSLEAAALSQQRLATALEATGVSLSDVDTELRYTWVQNRVLGHAPKDVIGKTAEQLFSPAEAQRLTQARRHVLETGRAQRVEFALSGPRGSQFLEQAIVPLRDASGGIVGLRTVAIDVTERHAEREKYRKEQEVFRVVQDQSLDAFEIVRPIVQDGRAVDFEWEYINPAGAAVLGRSAGSLVGRRMVRDLDGGAVPNAFLQARLVHWRDVMERGEPTRAEFSREDEGRTYWYQTLSVSLGDRLAASTRDITAQTRWLQAERSARAALQRTSKLKDEFLANLSHELRTPLNAIVGWAHVLGQTNAEEALIQRAAEAIARNARAQAVLVDDLLDMNRIVTGTLRLARQRCDLSAAVLRAVDTVQPAAKARWLNLHVDEVEPGLTVVGDPDRLEQVFWNLLTNAVKFTPLNGSIRVNARMEGGIVRAEVSDTGEGISPEELPHVFERFQHSVPGAAPRRYGGLGLGLAIVRSLVELHGGAVRIHSEGPGRGTTVQVDLPAAVPAEAGDSRSGDEGLLLDVPEGVLERRASRAAASSMAPLAWRRILLLDDDADSLELMTMVLRQQGAIVRGFDRAEDALASVENGTFDLVVSDLGLPGMDGLEFVKRLKDRPLPTKAIALTAYAGESERARAIEAGFARVETKPISPPHFLEVVLAEIGRVPAVS